MTAVLAVQAALVTASSAGVDAETVRARELFGRAEVHFSVGEFGTALELYKEAYKAKPLPGFLFNIGQCHRNLKHCEQALFFYRQYLLRLPTAENREEVEKLIEMCEAAEKRSATSPPAATQPVAGPPQSRPGAGWAQPATRPAVGAIARPSSRTLPGPPPAAHRRLKARWFWSGLGLSGALLVAGAVTGGMALSQSSEYKDPTTPVPRRRELYDSGRSLAITSSVLFAAGAAAAVGTGVLYFFTDFGERARSVSASLSADGGGIVVQGVF